MFLHSVNADISKKVSGSSIFQGIPLHDQNRAAKMREAGQRCEAVKADQFTRLFSRQLSRTSIFAIRRGLRTLLLIRTLVNPVKQG